MVGILGTTGGSSNSAEAQARLWGEIAANPKRYKANLDKLLQAIKESEAAEKVAKERLEAAERKEADVQAKLYELERLTIEREAEHKSCTAAIEHRQSRLEGRETEFKSKVVVAQSSIQDRIAALDERTGALADGEEALEAARIEVADRERMAVEAQATADALISDYEVRLAKLRQIVSQG